MPSGGPQLRCLGRGCSLVCWRPRPSKIPEASSLTLPLFSAWRLRAHTQANFTLVPGPAAPPPRLSREVSAAFGKGWGQAERGDTLQVPIPHPALCLLHPTRQHSRHPPRVLPRSWAPQGMSGCCGGTLGGVSWGLLCLGAHLCLESTEAPGHHLLKPEPQAPVARAAMPAVLCHLSSPMGSLSPSRWPHCPALCVQGCGLQGLLGMAGCPGGRQLINQTFSSVTNLAQLR